MTKSKRFSTLELVTYRLSNRTKVVYFDTLEEATEFAKNQKQLHPRSKKLNGTVWDAQEKMTIKVAY